jgi:hypothetical protein
MDELAGWSNFNVAVAGVAGALAGLLIVALSVNISTIIASRQLLERAAAGIAALVLTVVVCAIGLIPGQSALAYGLETCAAAAAAGIFGVRAAHAVLVGEGTPTRTARLVKSALGVAPASVVAAGGVVLLLGAVPTGLGLVAAGALLAISVAVVVAWVALVEVLR